MDDITQNQTAIVANPDGSKSVQVQFSTPDPKVYSKSDIQGFIDSLTKQNTDCSLIIATNKKSISVLQSLADKIK